MIYLLIGKDAWSLRQSLDRLRESVGLPDVRDANTTLLEAADLTPAGLLVISQAMPFLAERRLVIVNGLLSLYNERSRGAPARGRRQARDSAEWESALDALRRLPPSTDVAFVDEAVTLGNPLYTLLAPISEVQHFDPLTLDRLRMWIARQAESRGAAVAPAAVALLADLVGPDLWALSGELDKLSLYAGKRSITEEDVARLVSATKEVKIFAVVDAIVERNQSLALRRLETMIAQEDVSPFQVLSMLARQARLMLLCQEMFQRGTAQQELGKRLGLTGYPLQKTQEQARRYTWQQLLWLHGKLLETDVAVKTGVMEEIVALEVLIAEVCAPARPLAPAGPARGPG